MRPPTSPHIARGTSMCPPTSPHITRGTSMCPPNPPRIARGTHCGISVYKIGATPTVLLFIKFGLIRLLPWRPLNCAPWFRAIKLKIADAREHHEFPRLRKYRFAAPTGRPSKCGAGVLRDTRLPSRPSQVKHEARMAKQKASYSPDMIPREEPTPQNTGKGR